MNLMIVNLNINVSIVNNIAKKNQLVLMKKSRVRN